jgi:hypothetical protein
MTFVAMTFLALCDGDDARKAAEAEVAAQGLPRDLLVRGRLNFRETAMEGLLPLAIAGVLAVLAALNLAGIGVGRVLSWVLQPIVLLLGGVVTGGQVFATRQLQMAFTGSGDEDLARLDVVKVVAAAVGEFPRWFRPMVVGRFVLVTAGSVVIIVLLAVSASSSHY